MQATLELVIFRLVEGADMQAFDKAVADTDEFLNGLEGFISRELLRDNDGNWVDSVRWASLEHAMAALEKFNTHEAAQVFGSLIDAQSIRMMHLHSARQTA